MYMISATRGTQAAVKIVDNRKEAVKASKAYKEKYSNIVVIIKKI